MKKRRILSLALVLVLCLGLLAGCSKEETPASEAPAEESVYRILYSSELTSLNYLYVSTTAEFQAGANFVDTLVDYDQYGIAQSALATEWTTSEDGLTWTFKLREGVKWYRYDGTEYADLKAQDFVDGLKWVLTSTNESKTSDIVTSVVKNAQKYYSGEITDFSQVGVRAVDDLTLEYTLEAPTPYFLSMLSYVCFMPVNGDFLTEVGSSFGTTNDTLLYCGAYLCESFEPQVGRVYVKNSNYWDADNVHIDRIEATYNAEANSIAPEMYLRGEIDQATISTDLLDDWLQDDAKKDLVRPTRLSSYTYWWLFNFDPKFDDTYEPDNWKLAVNNEDFRLSIAYGIDREKAEYPYEPFNPDANLLRTITPEGFASVDGKDYTQMGDLADITNTDPYNPDKAVEYRDKAIEELTAAGATFPIKILMSYNPATSGWGDSCLVIEQQLEELLGKDYIDVIVEAGPSTNFLTEVRRSGKYALMLCNWGPDYADPETYSDPWSLGYTYNWPELATDEQYQTGHIYTLEDMQAGIFDDEKFIGTPETVYIKMVQEAKDEKLDIEKRYTLFADAEAYLINHAFVVPFHQQMSEGYVVSKLSVFDAGYAAFGVASQRYKGQHVLDTPISMDEYYQQLADWETARADALAAEAAK
ncbi:MAG TPA: peptide ABC transporter substrate-binding protein [Oscillospiraceae bacterium]|nr:peptide ABC transporter substrate-binding protein [Oscillospiraceae bacterium]